MQIIHSVPGHWLTVSAVCLKASQYCYSGQCLQQYFFNYWQENSFHYVHSRKVHQTIISKCAETGKQSFYNIDDCHVSDDKTYSSGYNT